MKKNTTDSLVSLAYTKPSELEPIIGQHFTVYEPGDVGFSLSMHYEAFDPVRVAGFEEAKTEVIGEKENAMFTSAGLTLV